MIAGTCTCIQQTYLHVPVNEEIAMKTSKWAKVDDLTNILWISCFQTQTALQVYLNKFGYHKTCKKTRDFEL